MNPEDGQGWAAGSGRSAERDEQVEAAGGGGGGLELATEQLGALGVTAVAATDTAHASTAQRAVYVLERAVADTGLWPVTSAVHASWGVNLLINLIAGLLVAAALYLLLRSPRQAAVMSAADEGRLRALIAEHGARDSLGYFALRHDKNVIFSPTGKAVIGYRVLGGVSLAAGDPIGDPEAWPGAIAAWQEQAEQHGWRSAVLGASEQAALAYQRFGGLQALTLGDEAVVEVAGFDLTTCCCSATTRTTACGRSSASRPGAGGDCRWT